MGQNLTTWAVGFSNRKKSGQILHTRTAEADVFIFGIETYKSGAPNRTGYSCAVRFLSFRFRPDRIFRCELGRSKHFPYEKSDVMCVQRIGQTPRLTAVVVWRDEETSWVRCTARRTQAFEPRLTASGLAAKGRGECAINRFNLSWYFGFNCMTDCCCCCAAV